MARTKRPAARKEPDKRLRMTSIRLSPEIVRKLQKRGDTLGVGWQTVLKMIVNRYVDSEL